jgi:hypothetical protein
VCPYCFGTNCDAYEEIFLSLVFFVTTALNVEAQIWLENFDDEANLAVSGNAAGGTWSVTTSPTGSPGSFSKTTLFGAEYFNINNTAGTEGVWKSNVIDISAMGDVALEITLGASYVSATDYVRAYYSLDGAAEVLFGEVTGSASLNISQAASAIVSGSTLQIVVRGSDNTAGSTFVDPPGVTIPNSLGFDDVTITDISVLYSIASANWNAGTTWSTIGFAGATCNCTPDGDSRVIIGNNRTVNLNVDGTVAGVEIQNTGRLQWTNNTIDLTMARGGTINVQSGGTLTRNNRTGSSVTFNAYAYTATVNGTLDINTLDFNTGASFIVGGSGTITATDVLVGVGSGRAITNNITGGGASFTVSNNINFEATSSLNSVFVNNGILSAAQILFNDDNVSFTNSGTLSLSGNISINDNGDDGNVLNNSAGASLTFVSVDANLGDIQINNSGTITQSGTFIDIPTTATTANSINNLNGGTWNYSGTGHDTDLRLFANSSSNTFLYTANGAQNIITPVSGNGYNNLTLQGAGVKSALASFSVSGNWLRSGTATFTPAGFTVTFNAASGTASQNISATGGETFAGVTINSAFATSPQIILSNNVTVTGVLTMTSGNVELNGNSVTLSSSAAGALSHSLSSAAGWMYGGALVRTFPTTAVAVGNVAGFYPLGSSTDFRPFFIGKTNIAASNGTISITHTAENTATDVTFTDNTIPVSASTVTIQRRHDSFWTVAKSVGINAGSFDIRAGGTGYVIGAIGDVRLTRLADATGIGIATATTGSTTDVRANRTGLLPAQLNNNFYVASLNKINTVLPIELVFYKAYLKNNEVVSTWKTAQEINNHFFTVQKTTDFELFYDVGVIDGKGNSFTENSYSFTDDQPFPGRSYYRLKQTDFDGKFTYSEPVMINYEGASNASLLTYPNPSNGYNITVELKGLGDKTEVPLVIYDQRGQKVYETVISKEDRATVTKNISFDSILPQGIYIIKAGKTLELTRKMVVD